MLTRPLCAFLGATALSVSVAGATLTFVVDFTPQAQSTLSAADQALVGEAMQFWDDIIDGYRDGTSRTWILTVDTFSQSSSGGGTTLGQATITSVGLTNPVAGTHLNGSFSGRFIISTAAQADFNVHPDAGGLDLNTITHEIGHALGIGTLWEDNELYNDGVAGNTNRTLAGGVQGQLVGPATLAAYQDEFDPSATFVPVELDGGTGAHHIHWNQVDDHWNSENVAGFDSDPGDGGPAPTRGDGLSLDDELMTSVSSGSEYLSALTRANLVDLGFTLHPIPEPGTLSLLAASLGLLGRRRRG